jgi:hypothetical protein
MRLALCTAFAVVTIVAARGFATSQATPQAAEPAAKGFIGPDLADWEGRLEHWVYRDGALIGVAPQGLKANTFLCSKRKYGDFELSFQVWLIGVKGPNSGVQIRSKVEETKNYQCAGPQCDMGQIFWGSLYGEHFGGMMKQAPPELVKKVLKENDFNDYAIKCVGDRVTIKLNGETTVDGDFPKMSRDGVIAWQLHSGGPMMVVFRKIRFKELDGTK